MPWGFSEFGWGRGWRWRWCWLFRGPGGVWRCWFSYLSYTGIYPDVEKAFLEKEAIWLKNLLSMIEKRLSQLESEAQK